MKLGKILLSATMIAFVGAAAVAGTGAFFSDTETSTGNTFTAGAIDLLIDNTSYGFDWNDPTVDDPTGEWGQNENNSWQLSDLTDQLFFNFDDLKPGDYGEDTISIHVNDNDAWACMALNLTGTPENGLSEPEEDVDQTAGENEGELQNHLSFIFWNDDGDNVLEEGEEVIEELSGLPGSIFTGGWLAIADSANAQPLPGGTTQYIGKGWCFGEMTPAPVAQDGQNDVPPSAPGRVGFTCDGSGSYNEAQTDGIEVDVAFHAEQSRNNDQFLCENLPPLEGGQGGDGDREVVGAENLVAYVAPSQCDITATSSIQSAIGQATSGQTVCVPDGVYNEFTVDKPLTIAGLTNPALGSAKVVPSGPSVEQLALVTSSDVTITGLHFDGTGVALDGNQAAGIQISPIASDIDNVDIVFNVIENIIVDGSNTTASNKGIQWFTETNSGFSLTNSNISHNIIDEIAAAPNKGGYGIQTVGDMDNVTISYNTISNTSGTWGSGIALDAKNLVDTSGVSVDHNQIMTGVHNGTSRFAIQVEANVDGGGIVVNTNNIESLLYGGSSGTPSPDILNAEDNWWGTATPTLGTDVFVAPITNTVDFDPAEASAYPTS